MGQGSSASTRTMSHRPVCMARNRRRDSAIGDPSGQVSVRRCVISEGLRLVAAREKPTSTKAVRNLSKNHPWDRQTSQGAITHTGQAQRLGCLPTDPRAEGFEVHGGRHGFHSSRMLLPTIAGRLDNRPRRGVRRSCRAAVRPGRHLSSEPPTKVLEHRTRPERVGLWTPRLQCAPASRRLHMRTGVGARFMSR